MKLETNRLILRPLKNSDSKDIIEGINNLNVSKWLLVVPYQYTKKDAVWWINKTKKDGGKKEKDNYQLGIELKSEKKIIGGIGISDLDNYQKKATIGYWIGEKYWRNGYGSETLKAVLDFSFNKLKLRRIEAGVFSGNPSSAKMLEKFGFKLEGTKREGCKSKADDKIYDDQVYGLLKREYNSN